MYGLYNKHMLTNKREGLLQMNVDEFVRTNLNMLKLNRYLHQNLDLTENHIAILNLVLNTGNNTMDLSELTNYLQVNNSVMTRQVQVLIDRGYLSKNRYRNDLRKVYIYMTAPQEEESLALMDLINEYINDYAFHE